MGDIVVTIVGHVGTDVRYRVTSEGLHVSSFRLAATPRHWSRTQRAYVDEATNWFTVQCWRSLALNVARSLRRGQPVVVMGKFKTQRWTREGEQRARLVLDAFSVGHDLSRGVACFASAPMIAEAPVDRTEIAIRAADDVEAEPTCAC